MRLAPLSFLAVLACGVTPSDDPVDTDVVPPAGADAWAAAGADGVGVRSLALVDASRGTPANGDAPALDRRDVDVEVWYPTDGEGTVDRPARDDAPAAGPFPVLVFGHGFMSSETDHAGLAAFLASHGWVVAAPRFPRSSMGAPGGPTLLDLPNQPGDMAFVLDALLAAEGDAAPLAGVVDGERVAFGGMSLGGSTSLLASLPGPWADDRVDAVVAVAPGTCFLPTSLFEAAPPPVMLIHGDADAFVPFEDHAVPVYEALRGDKVLVELAGGTHTGFPDVTAALFEALDNADAVGCQAAGAAIQATDPSAIEAMFPDADPIGPTCAQACVGELPLVTMKPSRQGLLLRAATRAFLEAEVLGDADAAAWLAGGLGRAEVDVVVSSEGLVAP